MENKKLFVKVKLESAQYSPDLTGQKGFGGKVMFPLEAVYSNDHFTEWWRESHLFSLRIDALPFRPQKNELDAM